MLARYWKICPLFQQLYLHPQLKVPEGARKNYEKISHSTLGYWLWHHYLSEYEELLPSSSLSPRKLKRVMEMWMPMTTGHHGRPLTVLMNWIIFCLKTKLPHEIFSLKSRYCFRSSRSPHSGMMTRALNFKTTFPVYLCNRRTRRLDGIVNAVFPRVAQAMDIKDYWQKALVQAQNALTVFPPKAQTAPFTGINTLFPLLSTRHRYSKRCWIWISASPGHSYLFWRM